MIESGLEVREALHDKDPDERNKGVGRAMGTLATGVGIAVVGATPVGWVLIGAGIASKFLFKGKSHAYNEAYNMFKESLSEGE